MNPIVFIGGGGHFRACADVAFECGRAVLGYLSPEPGTDYREIPRLGDDDWLECPAARDAEFVVAVGHTGDVAKRIKLFNAATDRGLRMATLVSPQAWVSPTARLGAGTVVLGGARINAVAIVGNNCIINTGAIVEHDAHVGHHTHIATGALVNGGTQVGDRCLIGSGAVLLHCTTIGNDTIVGAAAVVTRPLEGTGTWIGSPARRIK